MITFYTNKGKTIDLYSMDVKVNNGYDTYSFSEYAMSPQGVNTFNGTYADVLHNDDFEINFDDLPDEVQQAVCGRLLPDIEEEN